MRTVGISGGATPYHRAVASTLPMKLQWLMAHARVKLSPHVYCTYSYTACLSTAQSEFRLTNHQPPPCISLWTINHPSILPSPPQNHQPARQLWIKTPAPGCARSMHICICSISNAVWWWANQQPSQVSRRPSAPTTVRATAKQQQQQRLKLQEP